MENSEQATHTFKMRIVLSRAMTSVLSCSVTRDVVAVSSVPPSGSPCGHLAAVRAAAEVSVRAQVTAPGLQPWGCDARAREKPASASLRGQK